jgi:replicative DNA helicase
VGTTGRLIRVPDDALYDLDAEVSVLGAVLLSDRILEPLQSEVRLRPEHFYRSGLGKVYAAMLALDRAGSGIDRLTLKVELEKQGWLGDAGGQAGIDLLAGPVPNVGNVRAYAERVVELARWRARARKCYGELEAISRRNEDEYAAAGAELDEQEDARDQSADPTEQLLDFMRWLEGDDSDTIPLPFEQLQELMRGGLRPGDTTIVSGWTSMGKSVFVDQVLAWAHQAAKLPADRLVLYMNEMGRNDRIARVLAGQANMRFDRIIRRQLVQNDWAHLAKAANRGLPFTIQPCSGWSARDIARHIRRHRPALAAVDLATQIPARETADWYEISRELTQAARQSGTHVLIVVQLNRGSNDKPLRPVPTLKNLLHAGAWEQDARNVWFVHRAEELSDAGIPEMLFDGVLLIAKQSNGPLGNVPITLNPRTMRFEPLADYERSV